MVGECVHNISWETLVGEVFIENIYPYREIYPTNICLISPPQASIPPSPCQSAVNPAPVHMVSIAGNFFQPSVACLASVRPQALEQVCSTG